MVTASVEANYVGHDDGVWAFGVLKSRVAPGWVQIEDVKEPGFRVEPGFSGAPVWDDNLKGVAGMAVAADSREGRKVAFIIPTDTLVKAWPELADKQTDLSEPEQIEPQRIDEVTAVLEAARQKLGTVPLDRLPDLAALPPGSRMVLKPNSLFVGREEPLKSLAKALKGHHPAANGPIAAVTGLGGIGKTQLASEFVYRYGQYFAGGVFWLSFADPNNIPVEVTACGGTAGLRLQPEFDSLPLADQVRLVTTAWRKPLPRLLIFDNCEDQKLLAEWRPSPSGCRILVTSRRGAFAKSLGVQIVALDVLPRPESLELLHKHQADLEVDEPTLNDIAQALGDLPLALELAGSYLEKYRNAVSPEAYLAQVRAKTLLEHPSLQGRGAELSATDHELNVGKTFALSYDKLVAPPATPAEELARVLLARAACFAPGEPIPRRLLVATLELPENDLEALLQAEDALARLVELGLLKEGAEGTLVLHQLLAAFVKQVAPEAEAQAAVEETLLTEANRLNKAGYPAPLLAWQPHLRVVTDIAQARGDERGAGLCNTLGYHLNMIGAYTEARPYYERALAISEQVLGPAHPDTASSLNNLASLLQDQGEYEAAKPYYERALAIREQVLGPAHPDTALSLNNLGGLLQAQGAYGEARPYFERALAIRRKTVGADHPDTALSLWWLGALLQAEGDATAQSYYEQALAIFVARLGPEHPYSQGVRDNLAGLGAKEE